jgi:hypothetical protein
VVKNKKHIHNFVGKPIEKPPFGFKDGEGKVISELCIKKWINVDWTKLTLERTQLQDFVLFCKAYAMLLCIRELTILA